MGADIPAVTPVVPLRIHGRKHWLSYTTDERPSEYHVVVCYEDGTQNLGNSTVTLGPGVLNGIGLMDKWGVLVSAYESGKTADEIIESIENLGNEDLLKLFSNAWHPGLPIVEDE